MVGYHLHIKKLPGVSLATTQNVCCFDGLQFDETKNSRKHTGDPGRRFRLVLWPVKTPNCCGKAARELAVTFGPV